MNAAKSGRKKRARKPDSERKRKALFSLSPAVEEYLNEERVRTGKTRSRIVEDRVLMRFDLPDDVRRFLDAEVARLGIPLSQVVESILQAAAREP